MWFWLSEISTLTRRTLPEQVKQSSIQHFLRVPRASEEGERTQAP